MSSKPIVASQAATVDWLRNSGTTATNPIATAEIISTAMV